MGRIKEPAKSERIYERIDSLSAEQLAELIRLRNVPRKISVSIRLDPQVLLWLKSKGKGHLTLINDILQNLMEQEPR